MVGSLVTGLVYYSRVPNLFDFVDLQGGEDSSMSGEQVCACVTPFCTSGMHVPLPLAQMELSACSRLPLPYTGSKQVVARNWVMAWGLETPV